MTNANKFPIQSRKNDIEGPTNKSRGQGLARLSVDAILAITDIVESVHKRVSPLSSNSVTRDNETLSGISGLVYRNIRNVTEQLGNSIDKPLALISKKLATDSDSASTQALQAALNGVLGDYLVNSENPLAIPMHFRKDGMILNTDQLREHVNKHNGKVLILVHGLCMNDLQWQREGHDHGTKLANELGMQAIYLHYNTGRHISENGKDFAVLMESLVPLAVHTLEMNILAHSMGGLVSRSALHYAENNNYECAQHLNKLVFLGTPHQGAALEKAGNWIDMILGSHFYTVPFARLAKVRSAGITDLRYGNIQAGDWQTSEQFAFNTDQRLPTALPSNAKCFAIASSAKESKAYAFGDGLVSIKSALGEHENPVYNLLIPDSQKWVGTNINHMQLLNDKGIYEKLKQWLAPG